ncbi:hypothetical protein XENTR_v10003025 [Xenopus tropicalis]|uniref:Sperm flagellar protein 2 isoform X2 n=1 Tax=Xenopus tropicalis TaxID=8364 RepID=A0A8J1IY83_XENTR|nr:sperm flagellar protein 2 isoform X2 [Xenopus tropicalis]KAE8636517.1 hypothetical protein XENTR_v10003025 [Xenopus tropicalis]
MSDIICQWLNEDLKLSKRVEPKYLAKEFSSGYLIGEVLNKFQLQEDFDQFSQTRVANGKLNNFTRIEPTLQLLGVPFDQNVAHSIMSEQHGVATRLLYQLFIALQKKKKAGLTGVAMETLRPAAPAKLQSIGTEMYRERLKTIIPRQSEISLQRVSEQFDLKAKEIEDKVAQIQNDELRKIQKIQEELRIQDIEKLRRARRRQTEIMARIQAAIVQIPKPPQNRTLKAIEAQKMLKKKKEAEEVYTEITKFEKGVKDGSVGSLSANTRGPTLQRLRSSVNIGTALLKLDTNDDYVRKIQKRLEEDSVAREQREKRRRRILMEQLVGHGAQEEAFREEQLINRLMRQSQQERRIAVQLMHARHEKEVMQQNRMFREKQYQERREREFQEALDREAALQKQAMLDHKEEIRKVQELHDQIAAERAEARYKKHYNLCQEIMNQILDFVIKTGEYRELTNRLIPVKLMREWKELFFAGYPLYDKAPIDALPSDPTAEQLQETEKQSLLDEKDYEEYKTMTGEWGPPEASSVKAPAPNNNILGYVVHRLLEIVSPPLAPTPPPVFPPFPIKGCVLGKIYSGKSTCLKHLAQVYSIQVLSVDTLLEEAIQAFNDGELEKTEDVLRPIQEGADKENKPIDSPAPVTNGEEIPVVGSGSKPASAEARESDKELSLHQILKPAIEDTVPKLSARAQLGGLAETHLKSGKSVPDELLISILVEAINRIPANTGWIMEGFPMTETQATLFEKALTGSHTDLNGIKGNNNKFASLVTDPAAPKDLPVAPSALDFAVLIEISDNEVLQRMSTIISEIDKSGEKIDSPPCIQTTRMEADQTMDQIQHRITGFLDHWKNLEMWFSEQQNILIKVNGEVEVGVLCKRIEEVYLTALVNKQNRGKKNEKKEDLPPPEVAAPTPPPPSPPPAPEATNNLRPPSASSKESAKKSRKGSKSPRESRKRSDTSKDKKDKKPETPKGKDSRKSGSPRGRSPGKKAKSVPASPEPVAVTPVGPPPIQPGSPEWVYVNEPLPKEIPAFLVPYWKTIENVYGMTIKTVLRNLRQERLTVIHYLYDIRVHLKDYLKRPDHKQEFVSQWQSDFNSTADDLWEDEETKAELHQRADDLRDRLWDICDNRKEEAEQERTDIMNDGWLQDHTGILINHFFSLMQAEVDRFQDTTRLLSDYYQGMEGQAPSEASHTFSRIPLLDIANSSTQGDSENPKRIPLIPRRAQSPEQNTGKQKAKSQAKAKEEPPTDHLGQISEADEKLITDTWQTAVSAIANMVSNEKQSKEAEEEKERQLMEMKEKERAKASQAASRASGKGGKKKAPPKSPNRKKEAKSPGPADPTPSLQTLEDSTELQKKQELKMKLKQEHIAALEYEEMAANLRLEVIKTKALEVCQDIASRAESAYKDMEMWMGARFLAEMASVEQLIHIARHHIETGTKIKYQLVLENTDFYINSDVQVVPDPPPPSRPPAVEISANATLTVAQLHRLYQQFAQIAPEGLISNKTFIDILLDITSARLGNDALPDSWMQLTLPEIKEMTSELSQNSDVVNWRLFLLSASLPWPYPSVTQLLSTLQSFKAVDHNGCGTLTHEGFSQAELWFHGNAEEPVPENPTEPLPFNRPAHLIKYFFDLFADPRGIPPQLNYTEMLLYFASHPDPMEGFYRALSVTAGKPILKAPGNNVLLESLPAMEAIQQMKEPISSNDTVGTRGLGKAAVTLHEVVRVLQHAAGTGEDNHRFCLEENGRNNIYKSLGQIFAELGTEQQECVAVAALMSHPAFQDLLSNCHIYKFPDIHRILNKLKAPQASDGETLLPVSSR